MTARLDAAFARARAEHRPLVVAYLCIGDPSVEASFAAHTRGGWRAAGRDDQGALTPGGPATFAVWHAAEAEPGLPDVSPGRDLPTCVRTVLRGVTIFDADPVRG